MLRRVLWIVLILVVPLPIMIVGPGHVPAARLIELGLITASVVLLEQASGAVPLLTFLLLFQGAVYCGLLWLAVLAAFRVARWFHFENIGAPVAGLILLLLALSVSLEIYRDPYQADASTTTLLHVYE